MFPKSKITEIYYMADDFCKEFAWWQEKYMVKDSNRKHCNKQNRMSDTEIITILILFHPGDFRCFSPYYKGDACKRLKQLFSCLVSYNCFVELREEVFHELLIWVQVVSDYQW